jgi:hypothetical protein
MRGVLDRTYVIEFVSDLRQVLPLLSSNSSYTSEANLEQHFGKTPETSKFVLSPKGFPLDQLVISTS